MSEMSVMLQGGVNKVKTGRYLSYLLYWHELLLLWEQFLCHRSSSSTLALFSSPIVQKNVVWFNLHWVQSCWVMTFTSSGFWLSCSIDSIMKVFDAVSVLRKAKYFYLMCFIVFVYLFLALLEHIWGHCCLHRLSRLNLQYVSKCLNLSSQLGQTVIPSKGDIRSDDTSRWVPY